MGTFRKLLDHVQTYHPRTGRDRIAVEMGIGSSQLGKLVFVEKEDKTLITLIDKGILTTNQAYLQVTRNKKEREAVQRREMRDEPDPFFIPT